MVGKENYMTLFCSHDILAYPERPRSEISAWHPRPVHAIVFACADCGVSLREVPRLSYLSSQRESYLLARTNDLPQCKFAGDARGGAVHLRNKQV